MYMVYHILRIWSILILYCLTYVSHTLSYLYEMSIYIYIVYYIVCFGLSDMTVTSTQATSTARLDVYGDSGIFLSPGYPNSYSFNLNLTYTAHLDSSGPLVVGLSMVIELEKIGDSCYDYVIIGSTVHCGNKTELTEGKFCRTSKESGHQRMFKLVEIPLTMFCLFVYWL